MNRKQTKNFIISISGLIGSGKTTVIDLLKSRKPALEFFPENVEEWRFLTPFYTDKKRYSLLFQLDLLTRFQELRKYGFVISERTPSDSRFIFAECLFRDGFLTKTEWKLYNDAYAIQALEPNVVIYLNLDVDQALKRIATRKRPGEDAIDINYLQKLDFFSTGWLKRLERKGIPVHYVNAQQSIELVYQEVDKYIKLYENQR